MSASMEDVGMEDVGVGIEDVGVGMEEEEAGIEETRAGEASVGQQISPETHQVSTETQTPLESYRTYKDVAKMMGEKFNSKDYIHSTALDIICMYLKGQKIIHIESKNYCEYYLYRLMLPAIFISTISSVISGIMKDSIYAAICVSILTAFNAFLLSIVTYLKLDARAEAYKSSSYSYDKLETMCAFHSGRILLNTTETTEGEIMGDILNDIEKQVMEIKDRNQFIVPSFIRNNYPKLYFTNIFTIVKHIQTAEMIMINNLKVIMNLNTEIHNEIVMRGDRTGELETRRKEKYVEKNKAINNLIQFREKYLEIDNEFQDEIQRNIDLKITKWYNCWCKYSGCNQPEPDVLPVSQRHTLAFIPLNTSSI